MNQHLRDILVDSKASYVHPKIHVPSWLLAVDEELSDQVGADPVAALHVSNDSEAEEMVVDRIIKGVGVDPPINNPPQFSSGAEPFTV